MLVQLEKYQHHGHFKFKRTDDLKDVCNAPDDRSGVYVVWTAFQEQRFIVYFGRSGKPSGAERLRLTLCGLR